MTKSNTLELCRVHLFDNKEALEKSNIPAALIDRILRIRSAYSIWAEHPAMNDAEIRDILTKSGISQSTAYEDIRIIKTLIGNISETAKSFHRFRFNEMILNAYKLAESESDNKGMTNAAKEYAKYNKLDQEDAHQIPFDEIVVQPFEPTSDPSSIGLLPVENIREKIEKMKSKYIRDIVEDVDYEEMDFNEEEIFNAPTNLDHE